MAIRIATMVAGTEANRSGKAYVVASTSQPPPAVFVLPRTHPELATITMSVMFEFTPEGECIRHKPARH
ncbi:MAG: hypothetical protein JO266_00800 [Acidobacteria bacterium]|nr:hypothetical protein [Acidobacteriota bacterium]